MGYEMAGRLAKGGADVLVWNRTKEKAEPLEKYGAKVADQLAELAARDIVFCMVSTWKDVKEVVTNLLARARRSRRCSSSALRSRSKARPSCGKCWRRKAFNTWPRRSRATPR